jgi:hypothetical protein
LQTERGPGEYLPNLYFVPVNRSAHLVVDQLLTAVGGRAVDGSGGDVHDRDVPRIQRNVVAGVTAGVAPAVILGRTGVVTLRAVILSGQLAAFLRAVPHVVWISLGGHRELPCSWSGRPE